MEQVTEVVNVALGRNIGLIIRTHLGRVAVLYSECNNSPSLGAHIINSKVPGERIVPACNSCNQLNEEFDLDGGVILVTANKALSCEA